MVIVRIADTRFMGCGNDSQEIHLKTYGYTMGGHYLVGCSKGLATQGLLGEAD